MACMVERRLKERALYLFGSYMTDILKQWETETKSLRLRLQTALAHRFCRIIH